ncbi:hypothetical protein J2Z66_005204 [Paenibacillus eucommiae]|uniref:Uncharacterized protein n=1 Tax=Paenibacillus eucommiae TaxID=1355755 RepID=A0ABS4J167_9BACL|nr:hypothetical protein [Paenibacillus eucommiae]
MAIDCRITATHCHEICNYSTGQKLRITTLYCEDGNYYSNSTCDC